MPVSPWKTYLRNRSLVWSGRSRRLAKIVTENDQERAQENNQPTPPKKPGSRSD